ncbi:MAG: hypothetical protein P4L51_27620 [Puia sp.]|nr:hypothetical protein [Puia sp.]
MNLLRTYKWFPSAKTRNHAAVDRKKIGTILDAIGLSAEAGRLPSFKVMLVDDGSRLMELKKSVAGQSEVARSAQLLVFAAFEDMDEGASTALTAVGTAMVTAALAGIDSTGIEDFDSAKVDSLLGLSEQGLHSIALLSLN